MKKILYLAIILFFIPALCFGAGPFGSAWHQNADGTYSLPNDTDGLKVGSVSAAAAKFTTGAGAGKVFTSDADGDGTWESAPSGTVPSSGTSTTALMQGDGSGGWSVRDNLLGLSIISPEISGRETPLTAMVSDDSYSVVGFANATSADDDFAPTIFGYRDANNGGCMYITGQTISTYDTYINPAIIITARITDSRPDPLNGEFSAFSTRPILGVRNNSDYKFTIAADGTTDVVGELTAGTKTFLIDHPLLPTQKDLYHMALEGPRVDLIYRGTAMLKDGVATVNLDTDSTVHPMIAGTFAALTQNAVCTSLQNQTSFNRLKPSQITAGKFTIECEDNTASDVVAWVVIAERADPFIKSCKTTDSDGRLIPEHDKDAVPIGALDDKTEIVTETKYVAETTETAEVAGKIGYPRHYKAYDVALPEITVYKDLEWMSGKVYQADDTFIFDGVRYKVNQAHTSQADWLPGFGTDALYSVIAADGEIIDWIQPTGAHDAYQTGDKAQFNGAVYESLIDANVWSPAAYPAGWILVE